MSSWKNYEREDVSSAGRDGVENMTIQPANFDDPWKNAFKIIWVMGGNATGSSIFHESCRTRRYGLGL